MKKLNLLLMMLASFTLIFASSCKTEKKDTPVTEITLSVSGGTDVTLMGTDITKDIIVTASEKATQDIVVSLTSNAAEGEATFVSPTVTIKQGEKTAVGQITFAAAKFPKGTDQKKITVTINTQTEHVTPDVKTTDFLVKGEGGTELIPLTIAGSATELNTTAGEQTLTVTATLTSAATEDVSIAIAYDGTSDNLKELFKEIKTITIAKDQLTGTATFKVGKGVEGALKLAFTTANKTVDLKTASLTATFATDKNNLTIAANNTTFNTTDAAKTMTVTATLVEALTEDLDIAITYTGSTENMIALFGTRTSIRIAADTKTATMDFEVPKSTEGTLKMAFAIENEDVTLKTASLTGTFTYTKPVITPLCALTAGELNNSWAYMAGFKIGSTTVSLTRENPAYQNKLGETIVNITDGDEVKVFAAGNGDRIFAHVWVDWNNDNQVTADELVASSAKKAVPAEGAPADENFLVFNFAAPASTATGTYHMRIGSNYRDGLSGCDNTAETDESRTAYDLTINYTAGGSVEPGEDPTFAVVNPTPGDIVVPATGDKEVTFKVQLSKEAEEEQTITLAATSTGSKSGIITPAEVTFAVGEKSKDVKIKFLSADFTSDAVTATVTVTGTSQNLTATAASIAYNVKGTAAASSKQDLKYYLASESGSGLIFTASDNTKVLKFYVRTDAATQNGAVTLKAAVTGTGVTGSDYTLTDAGTIVSPADSKFKRFEITVNKSAIGKTLVVSITSDDTTLGNNTSLSFPITLATAPAQPFDYKVDYAIEDSKNVEVTSSGWLQLTLTTTGDVDPETTLLLTPHITGGITIGGIEEVIEMAAYSESIWINVSNFNALANGTTGTLTFTSAYTTFAAGAGITFTIKK